MKEENSKKPKIEKEYIVEKVSHKTEEISEIENPNNEKQEEEQVKNLRNDEKKEKEDVINRYINMVNNNADYIIENQMISAEIMTKELGSKLKMKKIEIYNAIKSFRNSYRDSSDIANLWKGCSEEEILITIKLSKKFNPKKEFDDLSKALHNMLSSETLNRLKKEEKEEEKYGKNKLEEKSKENIEDNFLKDELSLSELFNKNENYILFIIVPKARKS